MSRDYISAEIDKINEEMKDQASLSRAMSCAWILGNFKGINLKVMDMGDESSVTSFYVLASATNTTQASSMADEVIHQMRRLGGTILSKEGQSSSDWILIDTGDVIIHIFQESARDVYGLEELWASAKSVAIPQSYYFSDPGQDNLGKPDEKNRDFF